jgi:hypothetical protein
MYKFTFRNNYKYFSKKYKNSFSFVTFIKFKYNHFIGFVFKNILIVQLLNFIHFIFFLIFIGE